MKIYKVKVNGKSYRVELEGIEEVASATSSAPAAAPAAKEEKKIEAVKPAASGPVSGNEVVSPIQGVVTAVKVKVGDHVRKGTVLLLVEAMKLENEVVSPFDGEVAEILVTKGQSVASKERIVVIR